MIENSENRAVFSAFTEKFPESPQRQLAELKLMLLPPPAQAKKQEEPIPERQNELAKVKPFAPVAEPKVFESLIGEAAREKLIKTKECVGCDLNDANLEGTNLMSANLRDARFCRTIMPDGSIANRDCYPGQQETNQSGNIHSGEAARKKLLETKECVGCDLQEVILRGANLAEASMEGVILYNADLRYSD